MNRGLKIAVAAVLAVLLIGLIVALKTVDVAAVGPMESSVGLSHLNKAVSNTIGFHETWYKISKILGYIAFAVVGAFAVTGVIQLVQRRSLRKVDPKLLWLGGLYIVTLILYAFGKIPLNFRPVIIPGKTELEASFPSSHTLMSVVVFGSAILMIPDYFSNRAVSALLCIGSWILMAATIVFRLLSGVHWLTDILGGILLSTLLLVLFEIFTQDLKRVQVK